jgi:hypothetical protein
MICDTCIHSVIRTFKNGRDFDVQTSCDLDGKTMPVALSACTRMDRVRVSVDVTKTLVSPPPEKFMMPVVESQKKELDERVSRLRGWPKGKKRKHA